MSFEMAVALAGVAFFCGAICGATVVMLTDRWP